MFHPALPAFNRVVGRLGWARSIEQLSTRSWTLAPGCTRDEAPSLFDADDLRRVTGYGVDGNAAVEEHRMRGGPTEHGACRAHLLRDVVLMNGHLFRAGLTFHLADAPTPWIGQRPTAVRERAVLACTHYGFRYFGHWLLDDVPLRLAAGDIGDPVTCRQPTTPQQGAYAQRFGVEIEALGPTRFRELVVVDDAGQNANRRRRMQALRERLHGGRPVPSHPGVMLWRGATGHARVLANEAAVAERLVRRGFTVVRPGEQTLEELVAACAGARVAVGVEGSQLSHALYGIDPGGVVLALQPPQRFGNVFKIYCDGMGLRYGFIVGHTQPAGSFTIDLDQLDRRLDRIDAMQAVAG